MIQSEGFNFKNKLSRNTKSETLIDLLKAGHTKVGDGGKVWFSGKMDKRTGEVISAKIGRIELQYRESNNRGDL